MLQFAQDVKPTVLDHAAFGLVLTYTGQSELWAAYTAPDGSVFAVAGITALEDSEWREAETVPGTGGLAAKALFRRYQKDGVQALEQVNGNCVLFAYDAPHQRLHLVTDCSGVFPTYECETSAGPLYGSHPDALAAAAGESERLDEVSLAEFIIASTVTPPFSYYQRIQYVAQATRLTFDLAGPTPTKPVRQSYFTFEYRGDDNATEADLADELAGAVRRSVRRRTLARLGPAAVALSGGLDSRALLACIDNRDQTFAFTLFNEPNLEFQTAEAIARAAGIRFVPLQRELEYYGDNAEAGVRISGGMGTFANNHFLGATPRLHAEGMQNLLTGCYCDYLFKGLPLNRRRHWLTGHEELAPFRHEFYFSHHLPGAPLPKGLRERWESRVPSEFQDQDSPAAVFQVEARRTFPLCYEGDNQQRVVPQRVTGWPLPVADREILELYCRIPYQYKLNRSLFLKTVRILCQGPLARVPDANTGARLGASRPEAWLAANLQRARRKLRRARPSIATEESWPNWDYYVAHSRKLAELWQRPNPAAFEFFRRAIGPGNVSSDVRAYQGDRLFLFVSLLTVKLWFEHRIR
jgi:asparagine synthase (glutamine-hydrolysing)